MSSKIYTRTGDEGGTSLFDGTRVPKHAVRVEAYGAIDEANSWVGVALSFSEDALLAGVLEFFSHRLYNCSSNTATPPGAGEKRAGVSERDVAALERAIDRLEERAGEIGGFVLPGGCRAAALLHVARTVCRRAERRLCQLAEIEQVDPTVLELLNRGSDLLFAAARYANALDGRGDVDWDPDAEPPGG
ncbi:MAG: cob(I)yrinic acid a,c-diamide adenosyltransferase [Polyangia bacterium]